MFWSPKVDQVRWFLALRTNLHPLLLSWEIGLLRFSGICILLRTWRVCISLSASVLSVKSTSSSINQGPHNICTMLTGGDGGLSVASLAPVSSANIAAHVKMRMINIAKSFLIFSPPYADANASYMVFKFWRGFGGVLQLACIAVFGA